MSTFPIAERYVVPVERIFPIWRHDPDDGWWADSYITQEITREQAQAIHERQQQDPTSSWSSLTRGRGGSR